MARVTVLGLGAMGSRVAARLHDAGHDVVVWNRTTAVARTMAAERGWPTAETPAQAAEGSDVVMAFVRDDDASRTIWLGTTGALAGSAPDALLIESSTVSADRSEAFIVEARASGRAAVVAPMIGSRPQADAGALVYLVGGDQDAAERAEALLRAAAS